MKPPHKLLLLGAFVVALVARAPGFFWGYNFPGGWYGHHVDEYWGVQLAIPMINPYAKVEWQHPYPKGMAAHAAAPILLGNLARGKLLVSDPNKLPPPPEPIDIILVGRVSSILYGAATVFVVFLLAGCFFTDVRVALLAAWVMALGGLHVSQSHFFLADVPSLFWFLLGTYLLVREAQHSDRSHANFFLWAAFCFGAAFGLKLTLWCLPTLAIWALWLRPRFSRAIHGAIFFLAGFSVITLLSYSPFELVKTFLKGTTSGYRKNVLEGILMYLYELPSVVSLPVALLAIAGGILLLRKLLRTAERERLWQVSILIFLPLLLHTYFAVFSLSHFPRHIIPFIPWMAMTAAWALLRIVDALQARGLHPAMVLAPFFIYLSLFVYDGERVFIQEPRNEAARWIHANVKPGTPIYWRGHTNFPGYPAVNFHDGQGRPPVLVMEMYRVNPVLSGMGWRDSYPRDYRYIFEANSQKYVDNLQAVFKGESEYREAARFAEGYFMPEYKWTNRLLGDRSRNYVTEIVIFTRPLTPADSAPAPLPPAAATPTAPSNPPKGLPQ
jgi:4-amino-4-deoxy-L-arabinose transferase-like glycosyltransferase